MKFKLKYGDGATKKIAMQIARMERRKFSEALWAGKIQIPAKSYRPDFDIISYSSKNDFEEQVLSIYSFLYHVGTPRKWTLYSDGTHSDSQKQWLQEGFPFLVLRSWNYNQDLENNDLLQRYLKVCHLSKKLHAIVGHDYTGQTVYADSDIVFYSNSELYFNSEILKKGFWFLAETAWGSFREQRVHSLCNMFQLNSGLLILNKSFRFEEVFDYLGSLDLKFEYFSEQSSFNYSFKKQHAELLDPRQFVVNTADQFDFGMAFKANEIALRHYVNPVRHKMWQKGWKWHFSN